jgi:serine/threonine protein kinase
MDESNPPLKPSNSPPTPPLDPDHGTVLAPQRATSQTTRLLDSGHLKITVLKENTLVAYCADGTPQQVNSPLSAFRSAITEPINGASALSALDSLSQSKVRDLPNPLGVIKQRFELIRVIGTGGMGEVFLARDRVRMDMEDNQPLVAIKVLKGDYSNLREAAQALQREAKKAQQLSHPNIVTVYDFDRDEQLVYITMEYLEGESLEDYLRNNRSMTVAQAFDIIKQVAQGLAYAHDKGFVHADIKPANIFLTNDFGVKLLDFGIAQAVRSASDERRSAGEGWTRNALTPSYASPQMLAHHELHPSDDIYGLGVVLHELLTGQHPFLDSQNNPLSADKAQQFGRKLVPLKELSRRLNQVLASALAFDNKSRYQSAYEFLAALQPPNRLKQVFAATTVCALATIVITGFLQFREIPPPTLEDLSSDLQRTKDLIIEADQLLATGEIAMAHGLYAQAKDALDQKQNAAPENLQIALKILRNRRSKLIDALTERQNDSNLTRFQLQELQLALNYLAGDELTENKSHINQQIAKLAQRLSTMRTTGEDSQ